VSSMTWGAHGVPPCRCPPLCGLPKCHSCSLLYSASNASHVNGHVYPCEAKVRAMQAAAAVVVGTQETCLPTLAAVASFLALALLIQHFFSGGLRCSSTPNTNSRHVQT
jgi:hypothetical protein